VWGATVLTGLHATNDIYFPHDRDLVGVLDGSNVPKKSTNGTTWTQLGITAPSVAPTAGAVAGGSLTAGNVIEPATRIKWTTLARRATKHDGAGNAGRREPDRPGDVTGPADPQVDTIYVYAATSRRARRCGARPARWRIPDGDRFDVTANNWTAAVEAPTDHNVPPALSFAVPWKNRWWARDATVKNRIRFTQIFQNQSWPATFFIDIPFERGDEVAAIMPIGDTLVIFGQVSKPFLIIGQTSLDFEVRPSAAAEAGALGTARGGAHRERHRARGGRRGLHLRRRDRSAAVVRHRSVGWQDLVARDVADDLAGGRDLPPQAEGSADRGAAALSLRRPGNGSST
jgi:hypothetical protein